MGDSPLNLCSNDPSPPRWPLLILAGGQGSRLGGCDKAALPAPTGCHRSLIAEAIAGHAAVGPVWVASGPTARTDLPPTQLQLLDPSPVETLAPGGRAGPLAGLCAGIAHALSLADGSILLSCPVDVIGLRSELLRVLAEHIRDQPQLQVLVAQREQQREPLIAAWRVDAALLLSCRAALDSGERAVHRWQQSLRHACFLVADDEPEWINVNTPEDLARVLRRGSESG